MMQYGNKYARLMLQNSNITDPGAIAKKPLKCRNIGCYHLE